jgi:1,4-alpha-glucan branching enzyme
MLEIVSRRRLHSECFETNQTATPIARLGIAQISFFMNSIDQKPDANTYSAYSAKHMAKPVNFYYDAPQAKTVHIEGDFCDWAPLPMQRRVDGWWFLQVDLTHGHHQYRFNVDGQRLLDPRAVGTTRNEANEEVSIVSVS